jgi:hypothetical protein
MAIEVQEIVTSVRLLLNDVGADRWDDDQLLNWIYEAHIQVINDAPDLCKVRGVVATVAGAAQTLPATIHTLVYVYGICNVSGVVSSILTEVTDTELFIENPAWMSAAAATPVHWAHNSANAGAYYLYPFSAGTGYILADYIEQPTLGTDVATDTLDMFDVTLIPAFVDYVLYRAFGIDSDHTENMALSKDYLSSYVAKLAGVMDSDATLRAPRVAPGQGGGKK